MKPKVVRIFEVKGERSLRVEAVGEGRILSIKGARRERRILHT